jgi:hypothetical protein
LAFEADEATGNTASPQTTLGLYEGELEIRLRHLKQRSGWVFPCKQFVLTLGNIQERNVAFSRAAKLGN